MSATQEVKAQDVGVPVPTSVDAAINLLTSVTKQNSDAIKTIQTSVDAINAKLTKAEDVNPVAHGVTVENQQKVQDPMDVGDKVTAGNAYGQSIQANIIAPAAKDPGADTNGLQMESKAVVAKEEEEKKEEKKEEKEVEKVVTQVKKVYQYETVEAVRPRFYNKSIPERPATAYQMLKAIESGWGGKTNDPQEALTIAINKFEDGEFGTGFAVGA